jgi:hypothetical protein
MVIIQSSRLCSKLLSLIQNESSHQNNYCMYGQHHGPAMHLQFNIALMPVEISVVHTKDIV